MYHAFAAPIPSVIWGGTSYTVQKLNSVNMSLIETFALNERIQLDFSAGATNVLNHPSFALPDKSSGPGHKGQTTYVSVGARETELAAKIRF